MTDNDATLELIAEHVRRLLSIMGFSVSVDCHQSHSEEISRTTISVKSKDSHLLIGNNGMSLAALEHIIRCHLRGKINDMGRLSVDVNGYRAERAVKLANFAEEVAKKATRDGRPIALKPMSPPDRRAIHTALSDRTDVRTESTGEEPNRRVLVKPVFLS